MAEYDKRTFPTDCRLSPNGQKSCINNVVVKADSVTPHAAFNSKTLNNDIALIRLREPAPYTGKYIYNSFYISLLLLSHLF